jgi:RNA polymerase sigma-70 factor, ECF subfamily
MHRLLGSDSEVEDVTQEVYLRAFSSIARLRDPQAYASWLAGIVVRCVRQHHRRRNLLARIGLHAAIPVDPDLSFSHTTPPDVATELSAVCATLDRVPNQVRLALVLSRVEGYSLPEISAMLECSLSTVKRRLAKAEHALAKDGRASPA